MVEGTVQPAVQRREDRLGAAPDLPRPRRRASASGAGSSSATAPRSSPPTGRRWPRARATLRTSRLGSAAIDVTGEVGTPDAELKPEVESVGLPRRPGRPASAASSSPSTRASRASPAASCSRSPRAPTCPTSRRAPQGRVLGDRRADARAAAEDDDRPRPPGGDGVRARRPVGRDRRARRHATARCRALAGSAYSSPQPPGSTFKVITTTAALEEGKVKLDEQLRRRRGDQPRARDRRERDRERPRRALRRQLRRDLRRTRATRSSPRSGVEVGEEKLVETAESFGFNQEPTLYNAEATEAVDPEPMAMPDELRRDRHRAAPPRAIGQGEVLATPLGMASVAQTIANRRRPQPDPDRHRPRAAGRRRAGRA